MCMVFTAIASSAQTAVNADGTIKYRENKPLYDPGKSNLSKRPDEWKEGELKNENG